MAHGHGNNKKALLYDAAGNAITSTLVGADQSVDVNVTQIVDVAQATAANLNVTEASAASILTDTNTVAGAVSSGQMQVDIVADGAGLATSANQLADGHNVTVDNVGGVEVVQATAADLNCTEASAAAILADTAIISEWDNAASDGASVSGDVAHDTADAGEPVKVGGVAEADYGTVPEGADPGPTAVADGDRCNLTTDLQGRVPERVVASYHDLDNVNTTYNTTNETQTSQNIDCELYRQATLCFDLTQPTGNPTDITFSIWISLDGTNYMKMMNGPLGSWVYDDTLADDSPSRALTFPICCQKIRLVVTTTGTGVSTTFVVANAVLYLRN